MNKRILITGGTGLIGQKLTKALQADGHDIYYLSRTPGEHKGIKKFKWDYKSGEIDPKCLAGVSTIIHLAGAGVADKRWTDERKKVILESRVKTTELLYKLLKENDHEVEYFLSGSAIGYYGVDTPLEVTEESDPGDDFLAKVCVAWEQAADKMTDFNIPVGKIRTGMVLSLDGGALPAMAIPFRAGLGAAVGSGKQMMSWIHMDDLVRMFEFAVHQKIDGAMNGTAPYPLNNKEFSKTLAAALGRPFFLPNAPGIALKLALGEMSSVVLKGVKVLPERPLKENFKFKHPNLREALEDLYQ